MRLRTLFALYLISTAAAIGSPFAIQKVEMARRRMIPVNSEAPLEPAPAQLEAPRGEFRPIPACQAPDGVEYYKDYHFSSGSDINDRRTFVPDINVQFCAVSKDGTVYLVGSSLVGASDNQSWFRAYTRAGQLKWSMPRDEYCSPPALSRDGTAYFISMPRTGNTALTSVDAAGHRSRRHRLCIHRCAIGSGNHRRHRSGKEALEYLGFGEGEPNRRLPRRHHRRQRAVWPRPRFRSPGSRALALLFRCASH